MQLIARCLATNHFDNRWLGGYKYDCVTLYWPLLTLLCHWV